jgi:hypothetical protein
LPSRIQAKLKVPKRLSNKKEPMAAIEFKKTRKIAESRLVVGVENP